MRAIPSIGALGLASLLLVVACGSSASAPAAATRSVPAPAASGTPAGAAAPAPLPPQTSASTPAPAAGPALDPPLVPPVDVKVAVIGGSTGAAGFYIGQANGYFQDQGINLDLVNFTSGVEMLPAVATNQVQAATMAPSPAMFNALNQGITFKLTADTGSTPPGRGFQALVLRSDLAASGQVKDYADLRGLHIAIAGRGISTEIALDRGLRTSGLTIDDVELEAMSYADMQAALANRAIDGAMSTEPFITLGSDQGILTRWKGGDEMYPNQAIAALALGAEFARTEAARRLVLGYVRGVRDFNDALVRKINAEPVIKILTETTSLKDPALWQKIVPSGLDPDGYLNVESLDESQHWYLDRGLIRARVDLSQVVDQSFADYAVEKLGRYPTGN